MRQWLPWAVVAVAAAAAIIIASAWALRPAGTEMPQPVARFDLPLPQNVGRLFQGQGAPALSPDGRHLALPRKSTADCSSSCAALTTRLSCRCVAPMTLGARSGLRTAGRLLFLRAASYDGWRHPEARWSPSATSRTRSSSGSWGRNGDILFAGRGLIYRVAESGGTPVAVASLDPARGDKAHRSPHFLPDGRSFFLTVIGRREEIHVGSLDSNTTKLVVPNASEGVFAGPASLFFLRGQSVVTVPFDTGRLEVTGSERSIAGQVLGGLSASTGATVVFRPAGVTMTQLQWFARDGRRLGVVGPSGPYQQLALSPSGKRVALQRGELSVTGEDIHIWIMELTTRILSRLTSDPGSDVNPTWSPDERSLAFKGERRGVNTIIKKI